MSAEAYATTKSGWNSDFHIWTCSIASTLQSCVMRSCQSTYPSKDRARMNVVLLSDLSNRCAGIQHGADFPALHLSQRGTPPRYFPFCVCSRNIRAAIALCVGDCLDLQRRARPPTIYGFLALKGRWSNSFGIAYSLHSPSTREKIRFP